MRARPASTALALLAVLGCAMLLACAEPPRHFVPSPFAPPAGQVPTSTPALRGASASSGTFAATAPPPRAQCDLQNSTMQDSGLPLLQMDPIAPRRGEVVTVTGVRLPPGPRTITLMTPLQADVRFDVLVAPDGRLRATFTMPPVVAGQCAMLVLDGVGVQSLGFPVRE